MVNLPALPTFTSTSNQPQPLKLTWKWNPPSKKKAVQLEELKSQWVESSRMGWQVCALFFPWNFSLNAIVSDSKVLHDEETRKIWAACVGKPPDPTWDAACEAAATVIRAIGEEEFFASRELDHKRGKFPVINSGILWGSGPEKPYNFLNWKHADALAKLFRDENIIRLATFQSASVAFFAPRLHQDMHQHIESLLERMPSLVPNFFKNCFSACAFNFGPRVVTFPHVDSMHLALGWCAVTALGDYGYINGGHLVLVEAKLVIQFPPGATIVRPSAIVTHANAPIQTDEIRLSLTNTSLAYFSVMSTTASAPRPSLSKRIQGAMRR
ncbi:hypothetical protein NMY22_g18766 [Coprinellus aureogranulatus]|nr:hypothetical protein NMY22_g18766 [Coprinellus aureogranulatus]